MYGRVWADYPLRYNTFDVVTNDCSFSPSKSESSNSPVLVLYIVYYSRYASVIALYGAKELS
ncbi:hypothetical protein D3C79_722970 [compost metagenome]